MMLVVSTRRWLVVGVLISIDLIRRIFVLVVEPICECRVTVLRRASFGSILNGRMLVGRMTWQTNCGR